MALELLDRLPAEEIAAVMPAAPTGSFIREGIGQPVYWNDETGGWQLDSPTVPAGDLIGIMVFGKNTTPEWYMSMQIQILMADPDGGWCDSITVDGYIAPGGVFAAELKHQALKGGTYTAGATLYGEIVY